jgi:hypothetical protein
MRRQVQHEPAAGREDAMKLRECDRRLGGGVAQNVQAHDGVHDAVAQRQGIDRADHHARAGLAAARRAAFGA